MSGSVDHPLSPPPGVEEAPEAAPDEAGDLAAFLAAEKVANDYHQGLED